MAKGEKAILDAGSAVPETAIVPVPIDPGVCNAWGVKLDRRKIR
ncbi:MAG: hypothetical protein ACLP9L_37120 [Thermoguttaceae bacterium]